MNKTYVVGDIHACHNQLKQALELANFDFNNDTLISLGDVVDRGSDSYLVIEELLKIKNLIAVKGNHDVVWFNYLKTGEHEWGFGQGGSNTLQSYVNYDCDPNIHFDFFNNQIDYYVDNKNRLFIHAGYDIDWPIKTTHKSEYYWDRDMIKKFVFAKKPLVNADNFTEIFIGHTPVQYYYEVMNTEPKPENYQYLWNLDCGAAKFVKGKVCIMNVDTKEYWLA